MWATSHAQNQQQPTAIRDVALCKRAAVFKLLTISDQALVVIWYASLLLDFCRHAGESITVEHIQ